MLPRWKQQQFLRSDEKVGEQLMKSSFSFSTVIWREIWQRKSRLISGLLTITLGIAVIIGIESVTSVSKEVVKKKLDLLGANILVLPQAASVDDYYSADIDAPTFPEEYVERIATSMLPGVDNLSPKLSRRIKVSGYPVVLTGITAEPMSWLPSRSGRHQD